MTDPIQPIPTLYDGVIYRSRCEARWAVVFDKLGWCFNYEPEGFSLPSGNYLPDFYIRGLNCYFEVKGFEPTRRELRLAEELSFITDRIVIVSSGPPNRKQVEWAIEGELHGFFPVGDPSDRWVDYHRGGFVSARRNDHPQSSLYFSNLTFLPVFSEVPWKLAFQQAEAKRFGVYE